MIMGNGAIKISDFGSARKVADQQDMHLQGTAEYLAPELIDGSEASPAADLWAVGCMLYQLLSGRVPYYHGEQQKLFTVIKTAPVIFPVNYPKEARDLVEKLLVKEPTKRVTLKGVKGHKFFEGFNWNDIGSIEVPVAVKGQVETDSIDVKVKQRKFSMLFTQMTLQKKYLYQDVLEPIEEVDEQEYV